LRTKAQPQGLNRGRFGSGFAQWHADQRRGFKGYTKLLHALSDNRSWPKREYATQHPSMRFK